MRQIFLVVVLVVVVLLAGCAATPTTSTATTEPSDTKTPADTNTTATDTTNSEESTDACQDLDRRDRPDVPEEFTRQTAVQFVQTYRNATLWNEAFFPEGRAQHAHVSVTAYLVNETATGYVVHTLATGGGRLCGAEREVLDLGRYPGDYFVNESLLALLNSTTYHNPQEAADHPPVIQKVRRRNWTIVERWNESSQ